MLAGRRLDVQDAPPLAVRTMTLAIPSDASPPALVELQRAAADQAEAICRLVDATSTSRSPEIIRVWVSASPRPTRSVAESRARDDVATYLVTARMPRAVLMLPCVQVDIALGTTGAPWGYAGEIAAVAPDPHWLTRRLVSADRARAASGSVMADPAATPAWDTPIQRCVLSADGLELWLTGAMGEGEVVSTLEYHQAPDAVGIRVRSGIRPGLTRRPGELGLAASVHPTSGTVTRAARRGRARRWFSTVCLSDPLGGRPVFDLAVPSRTARSDAWNSWQREHGSP
jgi:hypothetical protein